MKNHLLWAWAFSALLFTSPLLLAQGTGSGVVNYNTTGVSADRRVYLVSTGIPSQDTPLSGAGYQTALYWGPAGTTDDRIMVQVGPSVSFLTGAAAGTFFGSGRTITGLPVNGAVASLQSRAWQVLPGVTSYETALINSGAAGKGPVFDLKLKDPSNALEVTPSVGGAAGWRGYAVVPEPSTFLLGILGTAALFFFCKRRNTNA